MEAGRRAPDRVEQRGFGRGHPDLTIAFQPGEQRGAARGIEVGSHFVEEEDGRSAAAFGNQFGMGEHQAEE